MPTVHDIRNGIRELKEFHGECRSIALKTMLEREIKALESRLNEEEAKGSASNETAANVDAASFEPIDKYAWSETLSRVKVYIPLEGIGQRARETISVKFSPLSYMITVPQHKKRNYRAGVAVLGGLIDPEASSFRLKENDIVLTLQKKEKGLWKSLSAKAAPSAKPSRGPADENIMNVLKDMYAEYVRVMMRREERLKNHGKRGL